MLAGVTAGLLALTGIVFALLFLVVQFAATAQSPRLHLFRDNPLVYGNALGLVVGVMIYATTCVVVTANDETTIRAGPDLGDHPCRSGGGHHQAAATGCPPVRRPGNDREPGHHPHPHCHRQAVQPTLFAVLRPPMTAAGPHDPDSLAGFPAVLASNRPDATDPLARQAVRPSGSRSSPGDLVRENAVVLEVWNPGARPDPRPL